MKLTNKIINLIIYFFLVCNLQSYAKNSLEKIPPLTDSFLLSLDQKTEHKTVLKYGMVEGHVFVPEGIDPTSVIVQVGAVNNFNQTSEDFYTSPDKQGHFVFENTFTVGSSLNLMFWDQQGLLNKRSLPVYVSKNSGSYDVFLEKTTVTADLAVSFGTNQDLTKAGLCGKVTGLTPVESIGSEVYLVDNKSKNTFNAKYFDDNNLPNLSQNYMSANGSFCIFNVESPYNSFIYSLKVKLNNGNIKSFFVYLPSYTFENNVEFDAKSSLYRPVQLYSWDNYTTRYYKLNSHDDNLINWHTASNMNFSTSYDYTAISYNSHSENDAIYFPLGDEFLNIDYNFSDEDQDHFFVFQPRSALFSKKLLSTIKDYSPGQTYVDNHDPVVLKVFDPKVMKVKKLNNLLPLFNEGLGSLFLNLDTSDFAFDKKNISIHLKNITGEDVSYFVPMDSGTDKNEISGFFYNIPEGLYQLFVTVPTSVSNCNNCTTYNSNEKLLWTSLVESLSNKTQVLTNMSDNKILIENKLSAQGNKEVYVGKLEADDIKQKLSVDIMPEGMSYEQIVDQQNYSIVTDIEYLKEHSLFYKIDAEKLCFVPEKEEKQKSKIFFMGLVPNVDIMPLKRHIAGISAPKAVSQNVFHDRNVTLMNAHPEIPPSHDKPRDEAARSSRIWLDSSALRRDKCEFSISGWRLGNCDTVKI